MKLWPFAHTGRPAFSLMSPRESTTSAGGRVAVVSGDLVGWRVTFPSGFSVSFPSAQCRLRIGSDAELHIEQHGDGPLTTPSRTYPAGEWSRVDPIYQSSQEKPMEKRSDLAVMTVVAWACYFALGMAAGWLLHSAVR